MRALAWLCVPPWMSEVSVGVMHRFLTAHENFRGRSRHGMRLAGRVDPRAHWVDSSRALSGSPTPLLSELMGCA